MRYMRPTVFFALLLAGSTAAAQQPYQEKCPPGDQITQDACVKAVDLFRYLAPQLGTAVAGGNPILGGSGTLGGFGHVSFGVRVNAVSGDLPRIDRVAVSTTGAVATEFETRRQLVPLPAVDLALGIFGGVPLGLTNVGGLDVLLSGSYLPEFSGSQVSVEVPNGSFKLGWGVRLGIIQESLLLPGVSLSVLRRDLPTVNVIGRTAGGDSAAVTGLEVNTTAWRLTAGKSFFLFAVSVGAGRDRYTYDADATATVQTMLTGPVTRTVFDIQDAEFDGRTLRTLNRTSYFADLSVNMPFFRLVGEIGQVSGGEIPTFNTFGGRPADRSRIYGSVGARIGW
jgi:hypothetical protein